MEIMSSGFRKERLLKPLRDHITLLLLRGNQTQQLYLGGDNEERSTFVQTLVVQGHDELLLFASCPTVDRFYYYFRP